MIKNDPNEITDEMRQQTREINRQVMAPQLRMIGEYFKPGFHPWKCKSSTVPRGTTQSVSVTLGSELHTTLELPRFRGQLSAEVGVCPGVTERVRPPHRRVVPEKSGLSLTSVVGCGGCTVWCEARCLSVNA